MQDSDVTRWTEGARKRLQEVDEDIPKLADTAKQLNNEVAALEDERKRLKDFLKSLEPAKPKAAAKSD